MSRWKSVFWAAIASFACVSLVPNAGHAFPSGGHRATPFDGSSFTSSCVGHNFQGFGLGGNLGTDLATRGILNASNGPANCSAATSSGVGTVNSSAADGGPIGNLGGSYSGTASGEARAGVIKLQAANNADTTQRFTGAAANGGWNDQITVSGGTGQGLFVTDIHLSGSVNAQDPGTTAIFQILPYLGTSTISSSPAHQGAAFSLYQSLNTPNNGDVISAASFQISSWGAVNHGAGDPLTQFSVNETVRLVIPITYDLPVDVGIFASVLVGERAQSAARGFAEYPVPEYSDVDGRRTGVRLGFPKRHRRGEHGFHPDGGLRSRLHAVFRLGLRTRTHRVARRRRG